MSRRRSGSARVEIRLDPISTREFYVRATNRGERYPYSDNPIGIVVKKSDGTWRHSSAVNPGAGTIYGGAPTKEKAAAQCYRAHRSWVGY